MSSYADIPDEESGTDRIAEEDLPLPDTIYSQAQENATYGNMSDEHPHRVLKPGVYVPSLVFFKKTTEELDAEAIAKHAVRMAKAGVAGIVTQGTNGEAVHLTHFERSVVNRTTRDALSRAGYVKIPVIVGCGVQSTRETIDLCRQAQDSGGDYAIILPPSYYKANYKPECIKGYFTEIADASPLPILIYNYPAVTGVDLDSDTIIELAKHPNIVGSATTASTHADPGSGFMCLGGSADFTIQSLVGGGSGVVAGLANIAPKACVKLAELFTSGSYHEAKTLQATVARGDWVAIKTGISGTKCALECFFGYGG
ncbi:dihydrodipicolinate synthetase, partial [Paecilomyces variotii No. 5]